jgi:hypothetical protein
MKLATTTRVVVRNGARVILATFAPTPEVKRESPRVEIRGELPSELENIWHGWCGEFVSRTRTHGAHSPVAFQGRRPIYGVDRPDPKGWTPRVFTPSEVARWARRTRKIAVETLQIRAILGAVEPRALVVGVGGWQVAPPRPRRISARSAHYACNAPPLPSFVGGKVKHARKRASQARSSGIRGFRGYSAPKCAITAPLPVVRPMVVGWLDSFPLWVAMMRKE